MNFRYSEDFSLILLPGCFSQTPRQLGTALDIPQQQRKRGPHHTLNPDRAENKYIKYKKSFLNSFPRSLKLHHLPRRWGRQGAERQSNGHLAQVAGRQGAVQYGSSTPYHCSLLFFGLSEGVGDLLAAVGGRDQHDERATGNDQAQRAGG